MNKLFALTVLFSASIAFTQVSWKTSERLLESP